MKRARLYARPLSRPPTSKATGIDRTMLNRKMVLKMMLNSHHIGTARAAGEEPCQTMGG